MTAEDMFAVVATSRVIRRIWTDCRPDETGDYWGAESVLGLRRVFAVVIWNPEGPVPPGAVVVGKPEGGEEGEGVLIA